jgi:hypothetical protein
MAPGNQRESTLSARRAFVVHLGTPDASGRRRFSGRVEHLASGASTHFSSLKGLLAFLDSVLRRAEGDGNLSTRRP